MLISMVQISGSQDDTWLPLMHHSAASVIDHLIHTMAIEDRLENGEVVRVRVLDTDIMNTYELRLRK
jgi:hypothetical protein